MNATFVITFPHVARHLFLASHLMTSANLSDGATHFRAAILSALYL